MPVEVHDREDQDRIVADLANHAIGKPTRATAPGARRNGWSRVRVLRDARQCPPHFNGKSVTQSLALAIVPGDGFGEFLLDFCKMAIGPTLGRKNLVLRFFLPKS